MLRARFIVGLLYFSFLTFFNVHAQNGYLPYSAGNKENNNNPVAFYRNIEISGGYLPKSGNEGLKANIGANNILLKRMGVYTSLEYSLDTRNYSHTVGGTITIFKFLYAWGGLDLFTTKGMIESGFKGTRKEAGIGLTPYKFLVFRFGWSNSVGPSLAAGVRIKI